MSKKNENLTPMMKQYLEIKAQYPDALLLYRMGDFYELFMEDAVIASKLLDIALTTRDKNNENPVPMCGVPYHSASNYISRLVSSGYKVAICEQVEDPKKARGLVKRKVTRVITPGLILEEQNLQAKVPNYLAALSGFDKSWGLAYLDISTGELKTIELEDTDELIDEILRVNPKELIVSESLENYWKSLTKNKLQVHVEGVPEEYFDIEAAEEKIKQIFGVHSLEGFGIQNFSWGIASIGALINYVEGNYLPTDHIRPPIPYYRSDYMIIDETTIRNLELFYSLSFQSKKGSLISIIDKTKTPMGGRTLHQWLRYPLIKKEDIEARLDGVDELAKKFETCEEIRNLLGKIGDIERILSRILADTATPRDLYLLETSLEQLSPISELLSECESPILKDLLDKWDSLEDVVRLISNILVDNPPVSWTSGYVIRDGVDPELDKCRQLSRDSRSWLIEYEKKQRELTGINSLKVKYNKVFGYFIEVPKAQISKVPESYHRKQTLVNAERFITDELKDFEIQALQAEDRRQELEKKWFEKLCKSLLEHKKRIQTMAEAVAIVDCLASMAHVAKHENYCKPIITRDGRIFLKECRHPVLEKMLSNGSFVPNDIEIDMESQQILIITGPNMAGKSTILRQLALCVLLAHIGSFVPAQAAQVSVVDKLFTRLGASDDLARGRSTFMVEMQETAYILHNATPSSLVILDEIGRGTSTYDGMSIAWAVVEYLHDLDGKGVKTMCATHYHELTELEQYLDKVKNYNVAVKEWQNEIIFLHKLVEGKANKSYGIHVASLAGLPQRVIERADNKLKELEKTENAQPPTGTSTRSTVQRKRKSRIRKAGFQLPLFQPTEEWLKEEILSLDLDRTTPLMALQILYIIQEKLRKDNRKVK